MREILFRGKRVDNGEWVYGFYVRLNGKEHRIYNGYAETDCGEFFPDCYTVNPKTVGQYTGVIDKNGKKIFDGDIIKHESGATVLFHKVVFERRNGCAYFGAVMGEYETWGFCNSFPPTLVEVVGNIYDNPDLLKVTE